MKSKAPPAAAPAAPEQIAIEILAPTVKGMDHITQTIARLDALAKKVAKVNAVLAAPAAVPRALPFRSVQEEIRKLSKSGNLKGGGSLGVEGIAKAIGVDAGDLPAFKRHLDAVTGKQLDIARQAVQQQQQKLAGLREQMGAAGRAPPGFAGPWSGDPRAVPRASVGGPGS